VASAALLGLIAALGVGMAVIPDGDPKPAPPAAAATEDASTAAAPVADPAASACGLPAGDQTVLTAAPKATDWELVGTMAAPTAPKQLGPGKVTAGVRSCFAHSPTGALYAAVNFVSLTSDEKTRTVAAKTLTAKGKGRDAALAGDVDGDPRAAAVDGTRMQVAGFSFLTYDPSNTVVDLALRIFVPNTQSVYLHFPAALRWESGDWKVVIPPDGEVYRSMQPVASLTGYLPWSGA
jgi:hypothetical protein